ncbi:protein phosphatase 2C domain-containing protein [Lachnospiraceae bacterium 46-15]
MSRLAENERIGKENLAETNVGMESSEKELEDTADQTEKERQEKTEIETEASTETGGIPKDRVMLIGGAAAAIIAMGIGIAIVLGRTRKKRSRKNMMEDTPSYRRMNTLKDMEEAPGMASASGEMQTKQLPGLHVGKVHNIGKRNRQQDSFGMSREGQGIPTAGPGVLAIVADGMGGMEKGDEISALVTMTMLRNFDRMGGRTTGEMKLLALLNQANDEVNRLLAASGGKRGGSTLVAALVQDGKLYWITVGDSRLCLYRNRTLLQINREHVYGVELDEKAARKEITPQEAANNPQRSALTSYIGIGRLKKIDRNIRPMQLEDGDRLVLMSDGVFRALTDEEISAAMRLPVTESGIAIDRMIQEKNLREQDNYTAIILEYAQE